MSDWDHVRYIVGQGNTKKLKMNFRKETIFSLRSYCRGVEKRLPAAGGTQPPSPFPLVYNSPSPGIMLKCLTITWNTFVYLW